MGDANFEKESLPEILAGKIRESFEAGYTVRPIRQIVQNDKEIPEILTCNIKKNDIVIFVNYVSMAGEFDLTDLYNSYERGWLYQDEPIHPTVTGNRIIADFVIEKIIRPVYERGDSLQDDEVIYQGEPYVTYESKAEIEKYVDNVRKMRRFVPEITLNYLKKIKETIAQRIEMQKGMNHSGDYTQSQMEDFIQYICSLDKVILYSIGNNTENC